MTKGTWTRLANITGGLVSGIVFIYIVIVISFFFVGKPYAGVLIEPNSAIVIEVCESSAGPNPIRTGDQIIQIGAMKFEDFQRDAWIPLFAGLQPGDTVPIRILRDGQEMTVSYTIPGPTGQEIFQRVNGQWPLAFVFWLAGLTCWLFLRPRDRVTRLLQAFYYITAIWLCVSNLSATHYLGSRVTLQAALWLAVPIYWHLHWHFPQPLGRLPKWVGWLLYGMGITLAGAEVLQALPGSTLYLSFVLAWAGSLVLLIAHFILQPARRGALRGLLAAMGVALGPVIVIGALGVLGLQIWFAGVVVMGISALPGYYFYTIYQRQVAHAQERVRRLLWIYLGAVLAGMLLSVIISFFPQALVLTRWHVCVDILMTLTMSLLALVSFAPFLILPALAGAPLAIGDEPSTTPRIRANQAAAYVFFALLLIPLTVAAAILLSNWLSFTGSDVLIAVLTALGSALVALMGFAPFERFFYRRVLGMPLEPTTLIQAYTRRITACQDLASLRNLLSDEVLPSLLVRQSALLRLEPLAEKSTANGLQPQILYGISADQIPATDQVQALLDHAGRYLPPGSHPGWVRLAIPLYYGDQLRWLWLFGQHDPDDVYTQFEIDRLQTLAGSTALALANQEMARTLVALYRANVNRHEGDRQRIARYLHDDLLNELGVLSANLDLVNAPEFVSRSIPRAIESVRQLIQELRPPLLMYGLHLALRSLIDDLENRHLDSACKEHRPRFVLDLDVTVETYDPQVDLYLFRIAQQAINNALRHAQAQTISLRGQLAAEQVSLVIEDDGRGFPADEQLDLSSLLANKHYGLANMYERAEMIGAELRISSAPGKGVRVECKWEPASFASIATDPEGVQNLQGLRL